MIPEISAFEVCPKGAWLGGEFYPITMPSARGCSGSTQGIIKGGLLSKTLEIPGNQAVYDHLVELVRQKKAMAFVGAGVSAPLYPIWGGLIELLIQEALKWGAATEADAGYWRKNAREKPLQMAGQIRRRLDKSRYETFLIETFKPKQERFTSAHAALAGANFKAIITTRAFSWFL